MREVKKIIDMSKKRRKMEHKKCNKEEKESKPERTKEIESGRKKKKERSKR